MDIHAPPNLELPPLGVNRNNERRLVEEDHEVQALIKTKRLLEDQFNRIYMDLLDKSKQILQLVDLGMKGKYDPTSQWVITPSDKPSLYTFMPRTADFTSYLVGESSVFLSGWEKQLEKQAVEARSAVQKRIISLSNDIQNDLSTFERTVHTTVPILSSTTLYVCQNCNRVVSVYGFQPLTCECGQDIVEISQVLQIPVKRLNDNVIKFIETNCWLEHGIAHLLRQKNIETFIGYYVVGHSGVWHEIDVIGESRQNNYRIFCECKNTELKASHVFIFSGKMADVGCTRGYMFSTAERLTPEISRLARSKNISIMLNVVRRSNSELLEEMRDL